MAHGGEAFVAGSDKIVHCASAICSIRPVGALGEAVAKRWPEGAPFSHILGIDANRHGPSKVLVPLLRDPKSLTLQEVNDPDVLKFLAGQTKTENVSQVPAPAAPKLALVA
jgi:hypothetical protein